MTFDDGILAVYGTANAARPGDKPSIRLELKERYYYGYDVLGITRFYQAKNAGQEIDCVVRIPGWGDVKATDICVLDDGTQYQVTMVQPGTDEDGLRITRITLERVKQDYEMP